VSGFQDSVEVMRTTLAVLFDGSVTAGNAALGNGWLAGFRLLVADHVSWFLSVERSGSRAAAIHNAAPDKQQHRAVARCAGRVRVSLGPEDCR
jgi:hypothetical protein